ncbi:hypothetical protein [Siphonobacter sp.]|uniref:hypothetical protein n=1 Tax=Siphonobacter sp. TaxID=1869184 RepID=UPI003B3B9F08
MKKDIPFLPVEGVKVAIAREVNEFNEVAWRVYLLNRNDKAIQNVFVTSRGYSKPQHQGEEGQETSTLRHFFQEVPAHSHQPIEPIDSSVFHLTNEYWVSYFIDNQVYDKRFIFVPGSLDEANLIQINQLAQEGILHE